MQFFGIYTLYFQKFEINNIRQCTNGSGFSIGLVRFSMFWSLVFSFVFLATVVSLLWGSTSRHSDDPDAWKMNSKYWESRLRQVLKPKNDDEKEVLRFAGLTIAEYFKDVDWLICLTRTPLDLMVGTMLLRDEQRILRDLSEIQNIVGVASIEARVFNETKQMAGISRKVTKSLIDHNKPPSGSQPRRKFLTRRFAMNAPANLRSRPTAVKKQRKRLSENKTIAEEVISADKPSIIIIKEEEEHDFLPKLNVEPEIGDGRTSRISNTRVDIWNDEPQTQAETWDYGSFSFALCDEQVEIKRPDILDIIHFSHYANMAYVALDEETQKEIELLHHYSPSNDVFVAPYLVSLDHEWKTIVVSIRGTKSAADILVDLRCDNCMLDEDLPNADSYQVHAGFYFTAKNLYNDIKSSNVIQSILENESYSHYHIVFCGHSMGAAVAALLTYFFRKDGYLQTRCYSYSIPALACVNTAELFEEFCISVVTGHDVVTRFTKCSMEIFKEDMRRLLKDCDLPKYRLMGRLTAQVLGLGKKSEKSESFKNTLALGYASAMEQANTSQKRWVENDRSRLHLQHMNKIPITPMGPPGRILFLERIRDFQGRFKKDDKAARAKTKRDRIKGNESQQQLKSKLKDDDSSKRQRNYKHYYVPRWADREELREIILSSTAIGDHSFVFEIMQDFEQIHPDHQLRTTS